MSPYGFEIVKGFDPYGTYLSAFARKNGTWFEYPLCVVRMQHSEMRGGIAQPVARALEGLVMPHLYLQL